MHSLDLPVLRRCPSADTLQKVLESCKKQPADFLSPSPAPLDPGVITWLTRIAASDLSWLSSSNRESIQQQASQILAAECGRQATPAITRSFVVNGLTLHIHEPTLTADSLGLKTWSTSFLLARQLHTILSPHIQPDMTMLELGSGTGLVGITAEQLFGNVTMTDYLPDVLDNLQSNIALNNLRCKVTKLDWTCPAESECADAKYDVILASDCIYMLGQAELVITSIKLFGRPGGLALIAYPLRPGNADYVSTYENATIDWTVLDSGTLHGFDDFDDDGVTCKWHLIRVPSDTL